MMHARTLRTGSATGARAGRTAAAGLQVHRSARWARQRTEPRPRSVHVQCSKEDHRGAKDSSASRQHDSQSGSSTPQSWTDGDRASSGKDASSSNGGGPADAEDQEFEAAMGQAWTQLRKQLKQTLPKEQAELLQDMSLEEVMDTTGTIRKLAVEQIGPLLDSLGLQGDPLQIFTDIVKTAVALQLALAGLLFAEYKFGLHLDTDAAFVGLGAWLLGYLLRIFISIDQLAWPLYDGILRLFVNPSLPGVVYDLSTVSPSERQATLNKLAVVVAGGFLLPRYFLGWDAGEAFTLLVAPFCGALLVFDLSFMAAVIYEVKSAGGPDD